MKAILHCWRLLFLAGAVWLAPQIALVHALSHTLPQGTHQQQDPDKRHQATTVCDTCLAFAQLGAALPSRFDWAASSHAVPVFAGAAGVPLVPRHVGAFDARAPPASLT